MLRSRSSKNVEYTDFTVDTVHNEQKHQQSGGGFLLNDQISTNVESIVNGDYKLLTEMEKVRNMNYTLDRCIDADSLFDEPQGTHPMYYKPDHQLKCFVRQSAITDKNLEKDVEYTFKKQFSLDLTDIFMQKTLSPQDLGTATNYIYFVFDYSLNKLLDTLVRVSTFGPKTSLLIDHVYLLYKGGNTTRLLLRNFVREAKQLILVRGKTSDLITDAVAKLDELVSGFNIGDWDYMMKINFEDLKANGFVDDELNKLIMMMMQTFFYAGSYIKEKISQLLKSKDNTERYAKAIQAYISDPNTTARINAFVKNYNDFTKTPADRKIEAINIERVVAYDNDITKNSITQIDHDRLAEIYKKSFLFRVTGKTSNYKGTRVTHDEYFEADAPFVDTTNMSYIPEYLTSDVVYLSYLSNIGFCRRYALSSFNLIRLKVLNMINFNLQMAHNPDIQEMPVNVEKSMSVNAELVDVSVSNVNDCKGVYNNHYYYPDHQDMEVDHIVNGPFKKERIEVKIPSVHMMFADICHMLFTENLFVWEDPKYAKRIKRLFFLSLPCMYKDNMKTNIVLQNYQALQKLFNDLTQLPTIDEKLAMLAGHYDIIDSPYNPLINSKTQHNVTPAFMALGIVHKLVVVRPGSPYKTRYLEYLLGNYVRMLIVAKYIIFNQVEPQHEELVLYELQIHRIFELANIADYIRPHMTTTLTPSLTKVYNSVRGTPHVYIGPQLVQRGPMAGLPPADQSAVDKFFDPRKVDPRNDKGLKPYEETIIANAEYVIKVLRGLADARVGRIKPRYISESLF